MKIDLTITLSVVIIFVTSISPIIVTILNNKHQIKLKEIENLISVRNKVIDDFINKTVEYNNKNTDKTDFYKLLVKMHSYADNVFVENTLNNIQELIEDYSDENYEQLIYELKNLVERLNNYPK